MTVTIRLSKLCDIPKLQRIQRAAFKPLYDIYNDEHSPYLRRFGELFKRMFFSREYHVFTILADRKITGSIIIKDLSGGDFTLTRISIFPQMQGRGIAARAIALAEALFPHAQRWIVLFPRDLDKNRRCYGKAGYCDTGKLERISERLTLCVYEKTAGEGTCGQ